MLFWRNTVACIESSEFGNYFTRVAEDRVRANSSLIKFSAVDDLTTSLDNFDEAVQNYVTKREINLSRGLR